MDGPTAVTVPTDPGLVRLIVGNALKNACEAVSQISDRSTEVVLLFGASDREVWITVEDNGIGLPSGSSQVLFDMGTSTKQDHLGMGLALSAEAARALSGDLRLVSDSTVTRLELTFPIGRSDSARTAS
ncbi:ATP-binding protein [Humibacillus xanthopallidus]|uniref:ATP-binding protein n=1 Tax=Humibacillus xanthopallidus TaxID=412689 RepID=UPI00384D5BD1